MDIIENLIRENKTTEVVDECLKQHNPQLALFLNRLFNNNDPNIAKAANNMIVENSKIDEAVIRVFVCGNWGSSELLCNMYNKQSKGGYTWNNIKIVSELPADYFVVFNKPPPELWSPDSQDNKIDLKRTILFRMEPLMEQRQQLWGWWAEPPRDSFLFAGFHDQHFNNLEYHLSKTYSQLIGDKIDKVITDTMSTVVSEKYQDPGHKKRIDFLKFMDEKEMAIDVYGSNVFHWKNYHGSLPSHCKDGALFPYKYTFNAENHSIDNYVTEKLIDGIMAECLTFYWGPSNISDIIDERAYVKLSLDNFEEDYNIVKKMIADDEWSKRIDFIRAEKNRILNDLQFFPRIEKIIDENRKVNSNLKL